MDFNVSLAACIETAEHATEAATKELVKITRRYDLTPDGIEGERQRLYAAAKEKADAAKASGLEMIGAKIAELDAAEVKAAERRAADTDYMNRLQMKLNMIGGVDLQTMDDTTLKALFAEFANDPLAIAMIRNAIPGGRSVRIEPANDNGKKQQHLQDFKNAFIRAMDKASAYISPSELASGVIPWRSEVEALRAYIVAQNGDFSKNDAEVWAAVVNKTPEYKIDAQAWQMRFTN